MLFVVSALNYFRLKNLFGIFLLRCLIHTEKFAYFSILADSFSCSANYLMNFAEMRVKSN